MLVRLTSLMDQLEGDAEAKKSKNLPRGDYLEFVRLVSVSCIAALNLFLINATNFFLCFTNNSILIFSFRSAKDL